MSKEGFEKEYVKEAFDTNWIAPLGENVNKFEEDIAKYVGTTGAAALSAGTAAIHLAIKAAGVKKGDIVFCQSLTFSATVNPVIYEEATPVFIDSERDTWNMDPELLEKAIKDRISITGRKPKAIMTVYLYGMPAKIDEIMAIAHKYDIPVIEDSAEAFGSIYKGRMVGTFGDYGILSFNGNKIITTSGGGAIICPDQSAKEQIMWYATQAREGYPYYHHKTIGYNYRLSRDCRLILLL